MLEALVANPTFAAAAVTAWVTLLVWVATRVFELAMQRREAVEKQRVAAVQFYTDVRLRAKYLPGVLRNGDVVEFERVIREYGDRNMKFRLYGAQVSDQRSFDRINAYLHRLSPNNAAMASEYMQLDTLFAKQYERLGSDDFAALSPERQVNQLNDCARAARELESFAASLARDMLTWPELRQWRLELSKGSDRSGHDDLLDLEDKWRPGPKQ